MRKGKVMDKLFFHHALNLVNNPTVRASMSSTFKFNRLANAFWSGVRWSHSSCLLQALGRACSRNHFALGDSGTLYFLRAISTRFSGGVGALGSSIDSVMNITTIRFCSRVMPLSNDVYGAIGVSLIRCSAVVIVLNIYLFHAAKVRNIFDIQF